MTVPSASSAESILMTLRVPEKLRDSCFTQHIERSCRSEIDLYHKMLYNRNNFVRESANRSNTDCSGGKHLNQKKILLTLEITPTLSLNYVTMTLSCSQSTITPTIEFKVFHDVTRIKQCIAKMDLSLSSTLFVFL